MKPKRRPLATIAAEIGTALKSETSTFVSIGKLLIEAKSQLPHGDWLPWLKCEFSMSVRSVLNYMKAAKVVAKLELKLETVANLSPSLLYALGHPSDHEDAAKSLQDRRLRYRLRDRAFERLTQDLCAGRY